MMAKKTAKKATAPKEAPSNDGKASAPRGALAAFAKEMFAQNGKEWTGSKFVQHVRATHPDWGNPDSSITQAWQGARSGKGAKGQKAKPGRRPEGNRVGNGKVSIATIQFIKLVGNIAKAKAEIEELEKVLGDGTLPF